MKKTKNNLNNLAILELRVPNNIKWQVYEVLGAHGISRWFRIHLIWFLCAQLPSSEKTYSLLEQTQWILEQIEDKQAIFEEISEHVRLRIYLDSQVSSWQNPVLGAEETKKLAMMRIHFTFAIRSPPEFWY